MIQCGLRDLLPTQHPGNFLVTIFFAERLDGCLCSARDDMLGYAEMMLTKFCYLRQMGDADNLVMAGEFRQFAADHFGCTASDTGIHLVKYDGFHRIGFGQNGLVQAQQFHQALGLTGLALTKLDGTAKGGILFAIAEKLGTPIRFIGVGEGIEDLREFHADEFVDALLDRS